MSKLKGARERLHTPFYDAAMYRYACELALSCHPDDVVVGMRGVVQGRPARASGGTPVIFAVEVTDVPVVTAGVVRDMRLRVEYADEREPWEARLLAEEQSVPCALCAPPGGSDFALWMGDSSRVQANKNASWPPCKSCGGHGYVGTGVFSHAMHAPFIGERAVFWGPVTLVLPESIDWALLQERT